MAAGGSCHVSQWRRHAGDGGGCSHGVVGTLCTRIEAEPAAIGDIVACWSCSTLASQSRSAALPSLVLVIGAVVETNRSRHSAQLRRRNQQATQISALIHLATPVSGGVGPAGKVSAAPRRRLRNRRPSHQNPSRRRYRGGQSPQWHQSELPRQFQTQYALVRRLRRFRSSAPGAMRAIFKSTITSGDHRAAGRRS